MCSLLQKPFNGLWEPMSRPRIFVHGWDSATAVLISRNAKNTHFSRVNYSSYTVINSLSAAKCLYWDQSCKEKSKNESKLLAGVSSETECFISQWGCATIFQLNEKCWIFACGRQLNCKFNEWLHNKIYAKRHSRGEDPSEIPVPWIKRPYLVPAQAQGRLCCPMIESQTPEQHLAQV